jgi:hypothetical protein
LAATSLAIASDNLSDDALNKLKEAAESAERVFLRIQYRRAYAHALNHAKRYDELLPIADKLIEEYPRAMEPLTLKASALRGLKRLDDLENLCIARQEKHPKDIWAAAMLAEAAERRGRLAQARYFLDDSPQLSGQRNVRMKRMELALFLDEVPPSLAREADDFLKLAPDCRLLELQVLAAVYARVGRPNDALQTLHKYLDRCGMLEDKSYIVIALLAEHYQLPDVARDAYERVPKQDTPVKTTMYDLAQRRLQVLSSASAN